VDGVVLAFRERPRRVVYLRARPAAEPSPAQADVRVRFGEAARRARGVRGFLPDPETGRLLPAAAALAAASVRGYRSPRPRRVREPKWVARLRPVLEAFLSSGETV